MDMSSKCLRLLRALVSWAVIAFFLIFALQIISALAGWYCGIEWLMLAALVIMHALAAAIGPSLVPEERKDCRK